MSLIDDKECLMLKDISDCLSEKGVGCAYNPYMDGGVLTESYFSMPGEKESMIREYDVNSAGDIQRELCALWENSARMEYVLPMTVAMLKNKEKYGKKERQVVSAYIYEF